MIKRFVKQIVDALAAPASSASDAERRAAAIQRATAVLMIDVARADNVFEETELQRVLELVTNHFDLTTAEANELVADASDQAEELTSAYEFTRVLHEHLDADEEARIVGLLWQIAYADGELDKYEDSLVLKISDLLHVSRGRVMRMKHDAELAARQRDS